jgi:signal transduction histidine kinase
MVAQNEATVAEIRRLVYALRPPALDELGLVEAVRDHTIGANGEAALPAGLRIAVEEPSAGLPPLPAAVEVAAYRIALEALTNVARHAHAQNCVIRFSLNRTPHPTILQLEITDDGVGLPDNVPAGVGFTSMRERAAELGGTCMIEGRPEGGTRVLAQLPVSRKTWKE